MPHAFEFDLSISRGVITHNMFCVSTLCFPPFSRRKSAAFFSSSFYAQRQLKRKSWKWVY